MLRAGILVLLLAEGFGRSNGEENKSDGTTTMAQDSTRRILFGTQALAKDFPYFVVLRFPKTEYPCGGSIIANNWVMSAAHCLWDEACVEIKLFPTAWQNQRSVNPSECYSHDKNIKNYFEYDISLLKVSEDLLLDGRAKLVNLPPPGLIHPAGTPIVIVGWGETDLKRLPTSLMRANVSVDNWETCNMKWHKKAGPGQRDIPIRAICTQGTGSVPPGACYGDSGGPAVTGDGVVIGIASFVLFENNYCMLGGPTIYTSVVDYLPWIYGHIDPSRETKNITVRPEHVTAHN